MNRLSTTFLLSAIFALTFILSTIRSQITPVPKDQFGEALVIGDSKATNRLHVAVDFACQECVGWYLEKGKEIVNWVQNSTSSNYFVTLSIFPLPYHYSSFDLALSGRLIRNKKSQADAIKYYEKVLSAKGVVSNDKIAPLNREQIRDFIYDTFLADEGVYRDEFKKIFSDSNSVMSVRREFKFNAHLDVNGTPTFIANGVKVDGGDEYSAQEWNKFFSG